MICIALPPDQEGNLTHPSVIPRRLQSIRAVSVFKDHLEAHVDKPKGTIRSHLPSQVQARYCYRPRHNTAHINSQVFALLQEHALLPLAPKILRHDTDLLIPSTAPGHGHSRPAYWLIKKKSLLTGDHVNRILEALDNANQLGCRPHINGAERSDGFSAFHAGAFLKPSATKSMPWVSNDTLQPPSSAGPRSQNQSAQRMSAMIKLCLSIDSVLNTRGQRALKTHDPKALARSRQLHHTIRSQSNDAIDYGRLTTNPVPVTELDDVTRVLRFGNLGTCVAIGRGQSEKLHLDLNDNNALYTSIMVLGDRTKQWNTDKHQGSLYLPTLGLIVPMDIGDMVFFNASELPHLVIKLDEAERDYRTVITTFSCTHLSEALEHPPAFCLPWLPM